MIESPYAASRVERETPLPQVVVIHPADADEGRAQVEAVAKAIYEANMKANHRPLMWEQEGWSYQEVCRQDARAAIDALKRKR